MPHGSLPAAFTTPRTPRATALRGTRSEEPSSTRARLTPRLPEFGITRVANVTGLDRLGLPVYMAIRPNSRSLSVSQGKGFTADAAWVSGVMESIELWHAEAPCIPLLLGSRSDVENETRLLDLNRISARRGSGLDRDPRILWTEGVELNSGDRILAPYALVHVNSVPPFPPGDEYFDVSSNGLASGSIPEEAMVHALCELIERDAVSRWRSSGLPPATVDLETVDDPPLKGWIERCDSSGFDLGIWGVESPTGLPVAVALIFDRYETSDTLRGAAMGFGCHLRREVACLRALTEAVQSRLTLIAGSRDDLDRQDYEARRRHRDGIEAYRKLLASPARAAFDTLPDHRDDLYADQISRILEGLASAGMEEVVMVRLTSDRDGLAVVRAIVPGLMGPDHAH